MESFCRSTRNFPNGNRTNTFHDTGGGSVPLTDFYLDTIVTPCNPWATVVLWFFYGGSPPAPKAAGCKSGVVQ